MLRKHLWIISLFFSLPSMGNAAVFSTVSPYIQTSELGINSYVSTEMSTKIANIQATALAAKNNLQPEYDTKKRHIESIRGLQADSLLQLKAIESYSDSSDGSATIKNKIYTEVGNTASSVSEKSSVMNAGERY